MKCGLRNFDSGICYGLLYGSALVYAKNPIFLWLCLPLFVTLFAICKNPISWIRLSHHFYFVTLFCNNSIKLEVLSTWGCILWICYGSLFVLKCWYFSRWVFRIWRQKYREGKGKEKTTNLSHTFGVCVCGDRKAKQCFGWKEREERARGNQPSEPCRLWAPPKSEKIENWDVGHGFEILEPNKNFQFWILSEIQFWEMCNVFELCVLSSEL